MSRCVLWLILVSVFSKCSVHANLYDQLNQLQKEIKKKQVLDGIKELKQILAKDDDDKWELPIFHKKPSIPPEANEGIFI